MRELRLTKIEGRIYLFPVPVVKDRKYLIFCTTVAEAEEVILDVREKKIPHPDLISEHFIFLTYHNDKETKIFVRKPSDKEKSDV
jgi:hypothetical protein